MAKQKESLTYEFDLPDQETRIRELITYIADKCSDNPRFGATMLNKILWASDFLSYRFLGKPITGVKYQRLERGPAPYHMKSIREKMMSDGHIHIRVDRFPNGMDQHRVISLRPANLSMFVGDEIALVDGIIEKLKDLTAGEISEWSHQRPWKTRYDGDLIPYEACFLANEPVTAGDISRTEGLARKLGWDECHKVFQ